MASNFALYSSQSDKRCINIHFEQKPAPKMAKLPSKQLHIHLQEAEITDFTIVCTSQLSHNVLLRWIIIRILMCYSTSGCLIVCQKGLFLLVSVSHFPKQVSLFYNHSYFYTRILFHFILHLCSVFLGWSWASAVIFLPVPGDGLMLARLLQSPPRTASVVWPSLVLPPV